MIEKILNGVAQIKNCPAGTQGTNCLTSIPQVGTDATSQSNALAVITGLLFGVLAAVAVLIIVIQGVKFATSQGDPQQAADARRAIIYAIVGLVVALSAEAVIRLTISKL